ncbi:unnamed protein product [Rotaria socialis]|uniref:Uncharacterized protein n=3 Tax=Rotaria socialis TaxID=392032 RepID=A0A820HTN9_9BILA|nr:unnamed protein product [Rotaria socialis]CAF3325490.1 unnamed protein product [Rotaria socialis]CAF3336928.1 unnamed protein product [Rotaria socialis]CAF3423744.1 unnamed protein product [Rotaria socialis]CAF4095851.1 unnamed protein product [Rotaria socialis]
MNTFHFYVGIICVTLAMVVSVTIESSETEEDSNSQEDRNINFEIPRARSSTFLRAMTPDDGDISQDDDDLIDQARDLVRRDQSNSTHYIDSKGRVCVLCKWNLLPCCEPDICRKHHIRFNECLEIKSR